MYTARTKWKKILTTIELKVNSPMIHLSIFISVNLVKELLIALIDRKIVIQMESMEFLIL
jgi:hypothetical protein